MLIIVSVLGCFLHILLLIAAVSAQSFLDSDSQLKSYTIGSKSYGYLKGANNDPWIWNLRSSQEYVEFEIQILVDSLRKANGILMYYESNQYKFGNAGREPWFVAAFLIQAKVHLVVCSHQDGDPSPTSNVSDPIITTVNSTTPIAVSEWNKIQIRIKKSSAEVIVNGAATSQNTIGQAFKKTNVVVFGRLISSHTTCGKNPKVVNSKIIGIGEDAKLRIEGCLRRFQIRQNAKGGIQRPLNLGGASAKQSEACSFKSGCKIVVRTFWDKYGQQLLIAAIVLSSILFLIIFVTVIRKLVLRHKDQKQKQEKDQMILDILVNTRLQASPVTGPVSQMAFASPSRAMMNPSASRAMMNPSASMMMSPAPTYGTPVGFGARASLMGRGPSMMFPAPPPARPAYY